jgi:hypothetical protein
MKKYCIKSLLDQVIWIQNRNHRAYLSHRKKQLKNIIKEQLQ